MHDFLIWFDVGMVVGFIFQVSVIALIFFRVLRGFKLDWRATALVLPLLFIPALIWRYSSLSPDISRLEVGLWLSYVGLIGGFLPAIFGLATGAFRRDMGAVRDTLDLGPVVANLVIQSGPKEGGAIPINRETTIIGRGDECHITIKDDSVSREHCKIIQKDGKLVLEDMDSATGTFVNRHKITTPYELRHGDFLQIGKAHLSLQLVQVESPQIQEAKFPGKPRLIGLSGPLKGNEILLLDATLLGRGKACQIRLDDSSVSREHARIERQGENVTLSDINSMNGTFINGVRIGATTELHHGDRVQIGNSTFAYVTG